MASTSVSPDRLDGADDPGVGAAAAQISAHALADILVIRSARFAQERDRGHQLTGGAVAALKRIVFDEGLLHRMQLLASCESFDCRHTLAADACRERQTRKHTPAVDVDRTCPALAVIAAFLRACQVKVFSERIQEIARTILAAIAIVGV